MGSAASGACLQVGAAGGAGPTSPASMAPDGPSLPHVQQLPRCHMRLKAIHRQHLGPGCFSRAAGAGWRRADRATRPSVQSRLCHVLPAAGPLLQLGLREQDVAPHAGVILHELQLHRQLLRVLPLRSGRPGVYVHVCVSAKESRVPPTRSTSTRRRRDMGRQRGGSSGGERAWGGNASTPSQRPCTPRATPPQAGWRDMHSRLLPTVSCQRAHLDVEEAGAG